MYDAALWSKFHVGILSKLRSSYNRCIQISFGINRRDTLTNILVTQGLPSIDTVMANDAMSYSRLWYSCSNRIVMHLRQLSVRKVY